MVSTLLVSWKDLTQKFIKIIINCVKVVVMVCIALKSIICVVLVEKMRAK